MTDDEIAQLLAPVSGDNPAGEDLSEDQAHFLLQEDFDRLASGPATPMVAGAPAEGGDSDSGDWRQFRTDAVGYLQKSRHLAVASYLTAAETNLLGVPGLGQGLLLLTRLVQTFWEHVYPLPDLYEGRPPDYDARLTYLSELNSRPLLNALKATPLTVAQYENFSLRDCQRIEKEGSEEERGALSAAYSGTDRENVLRAGGEIDEALAHAQELESAFNQLVATARAESSAGQDGPLRLDELKTVLRQMRRVLVDHMGLDDSDAADEAGAEGAVPGEGGGPRKGIRTRQDIIDRLDEICRHYELHEPTSPVPFLLRRAKKVVHMNFSQIVSEFRLSGDPSLEGVMGSLESSGTPSESQD